VAVFNYFVTDQVRVPGQRADYGALRSLSDWEKLRGLGKHYAFNTATKQAKRIWDVPAQLPVVIPSGQRRSLRLPMIAEPLDLGLSLTVQIVTPRNSGSMRCGIALNGNWPRYDGKLTEDFLFPAGPYSRHVEEHQALNYEVSLADVLDGWNEVTLHNDGIADLHVEMVELAIKPSAAP
jgi:hypothetical protein